MENKVIFVKQCIGEALVQLMAEKDYNQISLTEICNKAGYSRMAYYRNFTSKEDILISYAHILADQFHNTAKETLSTAFATSYNHLVYAFTYFKKYHGFFESLLKCNLGAIIQDALNYYMDCYHAGENADMTLRYRMYYYAGGICNMFTVWIKNGMKESEEEMAKIVFDRLNHYPSAA